MPAYRLEPALRERMARNLDGFQRHEADTGGLRHAAVAVTIVGGPGGEACFLLTLRLPTLRSHAGQFALPGGRLDEGETPEAAARRELAEEVGLELPEDAVLGRLDDYPTRSGHLITPVVLWGGEAPRLVPHQLEVAAVYRVPLAHLDRPGNPHLDQVAGSDHPVLYLSVLDTIVYTPTAAVLYQLREVALHGRPTRVAHFEQPRWAWR